MLWLPAAAGLLGSLLSQLSRRPEPADRAARIAAEEADAPPGSRRSAHRRLTLSVSGSVALLGALATLALAIGYLAEYSPGSHGLTHVTDVVWIGELGIHYKLGIDGLNVFLVGLAALLFAAAVLAANLRRWERPRLFYFNLMLAESAVLGAFLAQDLALFVAFFDLMLIPFYFLIGGWGRDLNPPSRVRATTKLVIYTLVGSLLMLAGAVATGVLAAEHSGGHVTFVLSALQSMPIGTGSQEGIFL